MGELNLKEAVTKGKSVKTCICFSIQKSGYLSYRNIYIRSLLSEEKIFIKNNFNFTNWKDNTW